MPQHSDRRIGDHGTEHAISSITVSPTAPKHKLAVMYNSLPPESALGDLVVDGSTYAVDEIERPNPYGHGATGPDGLKPIKRHALAMMTCVEDPFVSSGNTTAVRNTPRTKL